MGKKKPKIAKTKLWKRNITRFWGVRKKNCKQCKSLFFTPRCHPGQNICGSKKDKNGCVWENYKEWKKKYYEKYYPEYYKKKKENQ